MCASATESTAFLSELIMSHRLNPVWGDDSLVFQWGDFSAQEQETLRHAHAAWKIVLTLPDASYALASLALEWFTKHFALMQDHKSINPKVRIICCYVDDGKSVGCNATAFSLNGMLECEQPTYAIHVNIHAVPVLVNQARVVTGVLQRRLAPLVDPSFKKPPEGTNCALGALMFVLFHELAHIVRGHLEWTPSINLGYENLSSDARRDRKALELDADFMSAGYCGRFIRQFFAAKGGAHSPAEELTHGYVAVVALYSMLSCLTEGDATGDDRACYYSTSARLVVVLDRLTETMQVDANIAVNLVLLLMEGVKAAVQADASMSKILDFIPGRDDQEDAELIKLTIPQLIQLENSGRLKGWLV